VLHATPPATQCVSALSKAGASQVSMNREGVVEYRAGDYLGTTSVVLDNQGSKVAESHHYAYGEERWRGGNNIVAR